MTSNAEARANRMARASDAIGRAQGLAATAVLSDTDSVSAFRSAVSLAEDFQMAAEAVSALRSVAIGQMRAAGLSYGQIAKTLGISRARVAQLSPPSPSDVLASPQ